jgi:hypothetical protein
LLLYSTVEESIRLTSMRILGIIFLLLATTVCNTHGMASTPDTIKTGTRTLLRYKLLLNNDTIPDYFDCSFDMSAPFSIRFYDGVTKKEIKLSASENKQIPYGKKHVETDVKAINVNCSDGHQEVLLRFKHVNKVLNEYSLAIYRYDQATNKMKVVFSFPIAITGERSAPDEFYFIDANYSNAECIDSLYTMRGELKRNSSVNSTVPIFGLEIIPGETNRKEMYRFNPQSNMFIYKP